MRAHIYLIMLIGITIIGSSLVKADYIDRIRSKKITNNDSVQYLVRNYFTALAGPSGASSWKELDSNIPDLKYYNIIVETNNNIVKNIIFTLSYDIKLDTCEVLNIKIDTNNYSPKKFSYFRLLYYVNKIRTK